MKKKKKKKKYSILQCRTSNIWFPGTSASSAGRLPEPKSEKPGKVQPPVRGRVTRSTTRKLGDEDMPDNCKQQ